MYSGIGYSGMGYGVWGSYQAFHVSRALVWLYQSGMGLQNVLRLHGNVDGAGTAATCLVLRSNVRRPQLMGVAPGKAPPLGT